MLVLKYTPDKDIKRYECTDSVEIHVEDGKTVSEMLNVWVRMMLAMGFNSESIKGYVNTSGYPYMDE
jgi:hypothetical protein